jgi:hypothetical protein
VSSALWHGAPNDDEIGTKGQARRGQTGRFLGFKSGAVALTRNETEEDLAGAMEMTLLRAS